MPNVKGSDLPISHSQIWTMALFWERMHVWIVHHRSCCHSRSMFGQSTHGRTLWETIRKKDSDFAPLSLRDHPPVDSHLAIDFVHISAAHKGHERLQDTPGDVFFMESWVTKNRINRCPVPATFQHALQATSFQPPYKQPGKSVWFDVLGYVGHAGHGGVPSGYRKVGVINPEFFHQTYWWKTSFKHAAQHLDHQTMG